ncbi:hypothetical protein B296_00003654 [Ensete ventricosum]|uniref:Uncharacterized protein n=1 Tax=Ensete ventricosum TaxID=4639 RepID=A0A426Z0Q3_ENSVE|nr:hypothetical protein B296_00003654 [Ensete ventricosum]
MESDRHQGFGARELVAAPSFTTTESATERYGEDGGHLAAGPIGGSQPQPLPLCICVSIDIVAERRKGRER